MGALSIVINLIAGELLSSRVHFLFRFIKQKYKILEKILKIIWIAT